MTLLEIRPQSTLTPPPTPHDIGMLARAAAGYALHSRSDSTRRVYESLWRGFATFCEDRSIDALPSNPATVALFLSQRALARVSVSTLRSTLAAIRASHRAAGYRLDLEEPHLAEVWAGVRRSVGTRGHKKEPVLIGHLRKILGNLDRDSLVGKRDAALLVIGFGAGLRRSELVGLDYEDVVVRDEGLAVTIRHSKTDQEAAGTLLGIPRGRAVITCPVRAYQDWLASSGIRSGPLFRRIWKGGNKLGNDRLTDKAVALIIKQFVERIGLNPEDFGGHSLRSGMITSAAKVGSTLPDIMRQSRHKSVDTCRGYILDQEIWDANVVSQLL